MHPLPAAAPPSPFPEEMERGKKQLHLAMIPWLAFGHLIPFLQLSISLARAGFRISFLSTPRNIRRLLPKLPQDVMITSQINLVELPLPHVDGLHEGAEATVDLPTLNDEYLKKAYDLLTQQPLELFVAQQNPDFIIHDLLAHCTADISRRFGIPRVVFSIFSAASMAFVGLLEPMSVDDISNRMATPEALTSPPPWIPFPSSVVFLPHEAQIIRGISNTDASGISALRRALSAIQGCEAIIFRSCDECEADYLGVLNQQYPKPIIPIGLLPPEITETAVVGEDWERIFRWLDGKPPRSVVFVVFGSECKLSRSEVYEIAHGLVLSELGFLWALRRPEWAADDSDALPPGFVTRTMDRGVVNLGWAPQLDILAHPAIGGSLFHAGWSTIIETVQFGHPLVLMPFVHAQGLDARLAVEMGLGVEVEREEDGTFRREAIARSLRRTMVDGEGEDLRLRSREMVAIFSDRRLHQRYLNGFSDFLNNFQKQTS